MAALQRAVATLRITGDDLDPDEMSALLGAQPTHAQRKGQEIASRIGGKSRIAQFGMWRLHATETSPEDLNRQVAELVEQLTPDLGIWQEIGRRHSINLFCGWFKGGKQ